MYTDELIFDLSRGCTRYAALLTEQNKDQQALEVLGWAAYRLRHYADNNHPEYLYESGKLLQMLGQAYLWSEQYDKAEETLTIASRSLLLMWKRNRRITEALDYAGVEVNVAALCMQKSRWEEAISHIGAVEHILEYGYGTEIDYYAGICIYAWYNKATAYYELRRYEDSKVYFEKVTAALQNTAMNAPGIRELLLYYQSCLWLVIVYGKLKEPEKSDYYRRQAKSVEEARPEEMKHPLLAESAKELYAIVNNI